MSAYKFYLRPTPFVLKQHHMIMFVMQDIPETTDYDSHFAVSWLFKIVGKKNYFTQGSHKSSNFQQN